MNRVLRHILAVAASTALLPLWAVAADNADTQAIRQQLQRYESALNASDAEAVMKLYAADAVFMPQHNNPAVGREAVRAAYDGVFKAIKLDIKFAIDEVVPVSSTWAYARTRSSGTVKVLGTQLPPAAEGNQELFLLRKESDGQWRFARYIFSTTNPPAPR
jgi:uncharacterized protein (TIGR02246 family)